jgi:hypothetical protein
MGVMAVLAGLTVIGYRSISKDAKLSSGKNAVMAALDNARAMAIKNNRTTMVVFVPRLVSDTEQRVEAVIAEWRGDVIIQVVKSPPAPNGAPRLFERFVVVNGIRPRQLPAGISVAGPNYKTESSTDNAWFVPSNLLKVAPPAGEAPGRLLAVMYGPDGTTQTNVSVTATTANNYPFVDFDGDGLQDRTLTGNLIDDFYWQVKATDEPCPDIVSFLAVFDEDQARSLYDTSKWNDLTIRQSDLSQYINTSADRIHFNRYTGVAMK